MTAILVDSKERTRFLRFAVVGLIGAVVDFGVMNLLRRLLGIPLVIAGTISFLAAVMSNFLWNRYWTYPDSRSKHILRQLIEFTIVNVIGIGIRIPTLALLEPPLERLFSSLSFSSACLTATFCLTPKVFSDNFTLAIAIIIVMFWNFFVNRYWTYSDVS